MPQLDVSTFPSQIFWLIICFSVLCVAMTIFLVPRMSQTIAARAAEIEELRQKAEKLMIEANQLSRLNADHLQAAKIDAHSKINQVVADLAKLKDEKIQNFENQLHQQMNDVQHQLAEHKREILASSQDLISHLIEDMYRSLTGKNLERAQLATVKNSSQKGG